MIHLTDVTKVYSMGLQPVHALRGVSLEIAEGEYLAIMGPSGSGKSTLMNMLGCLDRPTNGQYVLDGVDVSTMTDDQLARTRNRRIGFVFQQFNLLASHDTERIQTQVGGNEALHRLAAAVLLTFPGVPSVYYGDEIGLSDLPQLGSRGCMVWDEGRWNHSLLDFYRTLIGLRRRSPALQQGGFQMLAVEPDSFAFQRATASERVLVVAHRGQQPHLL